MTQEAAQAVIARIAEAAEVIAAQAGVGGIETAGSIVSYLAAHPEQIDGFMAGTSSPLEWGVRWHVQGRLSFHGQDGMVYDAATVRRALLIKQMEKQGGRP